VALLEFASTELQLDRASLRRSTWTRKLPEPQAGSRKRESIRSDSSLTRSSIVSTSHAV